jgi:hypothetical protein
LVSIKPTQAIKQGCLASAVRANKTANLVAWHIKAHAIKRYDATEAHSDSFDREQAVRRIVPQ